MTDPDHFPHISAHYETNDEGITVLVIFVGKIRTAFMADYVPEKLKPWFLLTVKDTVHRCCQLAAREVQNGLQQQIRKALGL